MVDDPKKIKVDNLSFVKSAKGVFVHNEGDLQINFGDVGAFNIIGSESLVKELVENKLSEQFDEIARQEIRNITKDKQIEIAQDMKSDLEQLVCMSKEFRSFMNDEQILELKRKGDISFYSRNYARALSAYNVVLKFAPDISDAWVNKGLSQAYLHRLEEASDSFDCAMNVDPGNGLAIILKAIYLGSQKDFENSLYYFDKVIELDPGNKLAWYGKAIVLCQEGKYDKSIETFNLILNFYPDFYTAWYYYGNALAGKGNLEDAVESYEKAVRGDPSLIGAWCNAGMMYTLQGDWDKAIRYFNKTIEINPKHPSVWTYKGNVFDISGKFEKALECYNNALKVDMKDARAWRGKGKTHLSLGQLNDASFAFNQYLHLNVSDADIWAKQGDIYLEWGMYEDAVVFYNKSSKYYPEANYFLDRKACALANLGKYEESLEAITQFLDTASTDASAWLFKGVLYVNQKKYEEAIECFDRSIQINPTKEVIECKGRSLEKLHRIPEMIKLVSKYKDILRS